MPITRTNRELNVFAGFVKLDFGPFFDNVVESPLVGSHESEGFGSVVSKAGFVAPGEFIEFFFVATGDPAGG